MADKTPMRRAARAFRELEKADYWGAEAPPRGTKTKLRAALRDMARETGERCPAGWHWSLVREDRLAPHDPTSDAGSVTLCVMRDGIAILQRPDGWLAIELASREEIAEGTDLAMVAALVSDG